MPTQPNPRRRHAPTPAPRWPRRALWTGRRDAGPPLGEGGADGRRVEAVAGAEEPGGHARAAQPHPVCRVLDFTAVVVGDVAAGFEGAQARADLVLELLLRCRL